MSKSFVQLKCFKHDSSSHRMWLYLSSIKEDDDFYFLGANRAKVIEHNGREWRAKEGALYILSKKRFYNAIVMFRENKIEYYVNIASPTVKVGSTYYYIDYDLDLKKFASKQVKEVDWGEYRQNAELYGYSDKLKFVLEKTMEEVEELLKSGKYPFDDAINRELYKRYQVINTLNLLD